MKTLLKKGEKVEFEIQKVQNHHFSTKSVFDQCGFPNSAVCWGPKNSTNHGPRSCTYMYKIIRIAGIFHSMEGIFRGNTQKEGNKLAAFFELLTDLHANLGQIDFHGELLPGIDVWIMRFFESSLQLVKLVSGKCGPITPMLLLCTVIVLKMISRQKINYEITSGKSRQLRA